jgi:hypothetical protein
MAQNTITGNVTNGANGQPLVGANVTVKGTSQSTYAGLHGNFTIEVAELPVKLLFSFLGYESVELNVDTVAQPANVTLNPLG